MNRQLAHPSPSLKASARGARTFRYFAYGLAIDSDVPLPELAMTPRFAAPLNPGELRLRLGCLRAELEEPEEWFLKTSLPDGQPWMWAARQESGFLLRYIGLADFIVDRAGTEIRLGFAHPSSSPETLYHLLLDQALPMVLGLRGIPVIHASSVITSWGVCAFMGAAGAGKSTLAASFAAAGYSILGDDCLAISESGGFHAIAAYPGLRLWTDSAQSLCADWSMSTAVAHYTRKRRLLNVQASESFPAGPEPLAAIYCLDRASDNSTAPAIDPLRATEAFLQLLSASFMLDVADRSMLTRHLPFIGRLVSGVAVRRLQIPNRFSSLPKVREAILDDLRAIASNGAISDR